ncbi:probable peroxygenase 4 isoform X2 [Phalaenopsis equestris]|uniref:probable peroxygenase 4 isoform X2 n=1 Tax=Phalaenopsis equestris TaxID=78828 RepID=UPI0009E2671F|nr:probable peroxygenase 4 isoform X2 [Phalaenopsis equestris]
MASSPADIDGEMTPLQKHASFFDRNKDGVIYPWETFRGFRAIGGGVGQSIVAAVFINGLLAPKTRTGKFLSPLLPIYVKNISKGKHGSDSGAYDAQGRLGASAEWKALFSLCKDDNGLLPKETVRAAYDGSLFFKMEEEISSSKRKA